MGHPVESLVDAEAARHLNCSICLELLEDPLRVDCLAEHTFCKTCIAAVQGSVCPTCRDPITRSECRPNRFAARLVLAVPTKCSFSVQCPWHGDIAGLKTHADICVYNSLPCRFRSRGCNKRTKIARMSAHERHCGFARVMCSNRSCTIRVLRKDMRAHLDICGLHCCKGHEECTFVGTLAEIDKHQPSCDEMGSVIELARDEMAVAQAVAEDAEEERDRAQAERDEIEGERDQLQIERRQLRHDLSFLVEQYESMREAVYQQTGVVVQQCSKRRELSPLSSSDGDSGPDDENESMGHDDIDSE